MPSLRLILLASLSITSLVLSQPAPEPSSNKANQSPFDFQELLNALPEESLHAALHKHLDTKYQDGVYEHDRSAVSVVHEEDPPTATKVLVEAALDLIKRQNSNSTSTETTQTTQTTTQRTTVVSTTTTSSSSNQAVVVPVEVTTTNSAGSTVAVTTSAVATASVSVTVVVTTTNSRGSTVVASSTVAAAVVTKSDGAVTTSPVPTYNNGGAQDVTTTAKNGATVVLSSVKSGQVVSTTDAKGSTFITTFTPGGGQVQSLVLQTTTLANGQQSTITSFAVVESETATSQSGSTATSGPKLQNGGEGIRSRSLGAEAIVIVGGALGVALLL